MTARGYVNGRLFGVKHGPYSIVVAAPDIMSAKDAFVVWAKEVHNFNVSRELVHVQQTRQAGNRPIIIALV